MSFLLSHKASLVFCGFVLLTFFNFNNCLGQAELEKEIVLIEGTVIDNSRAPVSSALATFKSMRNGQEKAVVSDLDGIFRVSLTKGLYEINISHLSYTSFVNEYNFVEDYNLGEIKLEVKLESLYAVSISVVRNKIKPTVSGYIIPISNDSVFKKLPLTEIFNLLPNVRRSNENQLFVNGDKAKVTIDGRIFFLDDNELQELMQLTFGDRVKSIEVIETPSAKFSANAKRIINIELEKPKSNGYYGYVSERATSGNLSSSTFGNVSYFTPTFQVSTSVTPFVISTNNTEVNRFIENEENLRRFREFAINQRENRRQAIGISINYNITPNQILYSRVRNSVDKREETADYENIEDSRILVLQNNKVNGKVNDIDYDLAYRLDFKRNKVEASFNYDYLEDSSINRIFSQNLSVIDNKEDLTFKKANLLSSRIDFQHKFTDSIYDFDAGINYDIIKTDLRNSFFENVEDLNPTFNPEFSNDNNYLERKFSGYVSLNGNYPRLKYNLGIRYESVEIKVANAALRSQSNRSFENILPILSLKYLFKSRNLINELRGSYRRGYGLPSFRSFLQTTNFVNDFTTLTGNPSINQDTYNVTELATTFLDKYRLTFQYNWYDDYLTTVETIEQNLLVRRYENISGRKIFRLLANTNYQINKNWRTNISARYVLNRVTDESIGNSQNTFDFSVNNNFQLPYGINLSFGASLDNGVAPVYENPDGLWRFDFSVNLSARFLEKKLAVSAGLYSVLNTDNNRVVTYIIDDTTIRQNVKIPYPVANVSLSYNFGVDKFKSKSTKSTGVRNNVL